MKGIVASLVLILLCTTPGMGCKMSNGLVDINFANPSGDCPEKFIFVKGFDKIHNTTAISTEAGFGATYIKLIWTFKPGLIENMTLSDLTEDMAAGIAEIAKNLSKTGKIGEVKPIAIDGASGEDANVYFNGIYVGKIANMKIGDNLISITSRDPIEYQKVIESMSARENESIRKYFPDH